MSITQRFNSLLLGAFLCLSILAGLFIFEMGRVYDSTNFANANIVPSMLVLDDATRNLICLRVRLYRHLLASGVDPARLVVGGDSAGGHLSLRQLDQLPHAWVTHAVVHELAAPLTRHKATPAQTLQMHGHTALRCTDSLNQFADIVLPLQEQQQNTQPGGIAHTGKHAGEQLGCGVGLCGSGRLIRKYSSGRHHDTPIIF